MSTEVRHPIFARLYARMSPRVDAKGGAASSEPATA
jgi:hypothetical protein